MTKEELKDKYTSFVCEVSEIMGLGKPVDIIKLCAITDSFFRPLEKRIKDLEQENAELKEKVGKYQIGMFDEIEKRDKRLTKAEEILREYIRINLLPPTERNFDDEVKLFKEAEQFLN